MLGQPDCLEVTPRNQAGAGSDQTAAPTLLRGENAPSDKMQKIWELWEKFIGNEGNLISFKPVLVGCSLTCLQNILNEGVGGKEKPRMITWGCLTSYWQEHNRIRICQNTHEKGALLLKSCSSLGTGVNIYYLICSHNNTLGSGCCVFWTLTCRWKTLLAQRNKNE